MRWTHLRSPSIRLAILAAGLLSSLVNGSPVPTKVLSVVSAYNGHTTITASTQVVTYSATTTSTSSTLTCKSAGTYTIGTSTTIVPKPTTIPWTAPLVIYEYCPFSVFELFSCAICPLEVTVEKCYLGYCDIFVELRTPIGTTTKTTTLSSTIGIGYLEPTVTVTSTLSAYATAYTSTIPAQLFQAATVIVGSPVPYVTSTVYLDDGTGPYTSTVGGTILDGVAVPTVTYTTTVSAYDPAYTSTISAVGSTPGTVIIATPVPYITSVVYVDDGTGPFTSTVGGTILDGVAVPTVTYTTTVSAYDPAYTSTISAVGSTPGTVIIATPAPYITSVSYLDDGEAAYTSTVAGDVDIGIAVGTITTTTFLPTDGTAFTSTVPAAGPTSATVIVGYVESDITTTITGSAAATTTIAPSGTIPGTVIIVQPTPDASCNNTGIQFAAFAETPEIVNSNGQYTAFDPTIYKTQPAELTGTTTAVSYSVDSYSDESVSIYGSSETFNDFYLVIDHRGYLFAQASGTYTFNTQASDDIFLMWIGATAYSGWTRANANLVATLSYPDQTFEIDLEEGEYYPLRFLWANGDGPGDFEFSITAPDGTTILDANTVGSPYLVQYSCDGTSAPQYAAWGQES